MTYFTDGEWVVDEDGLDICNGLDRIARAHHCGSWKKAKANAILISQAPALYRLVCQLGEELYRKLDGIPAQENAAAITLMRKAKSVTAVASGFIERSEHDE